MEFWDIYTPPPAVTSADERQRDVHPARLAGENDTLCAGSSKGKPSSAAYSARTRAARTYQMDISGIGYPSSRSASPARAGCDHQRVPAAYCGGI